MKTVEVRMTIREGLIVLSKQEKEVTNRNNYERKNAHSICPFGQWEINHCAVVDAGTP